MQKYINEFKVFYQKYRWWIVGALFFLLMMQVCSQGGRVGHRDLVQESTLNEPENDEELLRPLNTPVDEGVNVKRGFDTGALLFLMLFGLLFYVAMKRKLFQKMIPSIVWVSLRIRNKKSTGQRIAQISIMNRTRESIAFNAPVLVFGHPFKKTRKFQLKSGGQNLFPLTLTPETSHQISIDINQFKQKANVDKGYNWVKVELQTDRAKEHSSFWQFLF